MRGHKNNTKLKTLYVLKYFVEQTDQNNTASTFDVIDHLSSLGIAAERKSIYNDIDTFNKFGICIVKQGHAFFYQPTEGDLFHEITNGVS